MKTPVLPQISFSRRCLTLFAAGQLVLAVLGAASAGAQTLLYQYTFSDSGNVALNTHPTNPDMTLNSAPSTPADLHGGPGSGVSGQAGDLAFDNSGSSGMGSAAGTGGGLGVISGGGATISGLSAFTITGWFNAVSATGGATRLFTTSNSATALLFPNDDLQFVVNGTNLLSTSGPSDNGAFQATDSWIFFAVTYDSTTAAGQVKARMYYGTDVSTAASIASTTTTAGVVGTTGNDLILGNTSTGTRPFDGLMDDFRIYSGALTVDQLNEVRLEGVTNVPEPAGLALFLPLAAAAALHRRRNRR